MINGIKRFFNIEKNAAKTDSKLIRPSTLPKSGKNEAVTGVSIKQVKEMLHSDDISQVIKLFSLMTQRDLHLSGALSSRRDQLQSLPFTIEGDSEASKFALAYLEGIEFNLLLQDLSSALEYGFTVLDLNWDVQTINDKPYFVPVRQKMLSARYFNYDDKKHTDKEALYFTIGDKKKYLSSYDTRKMLLHLHKTDTEHITRYSPLYKAAWFIALKHQVIASNMQWFDALGVPPLIINQDTADEKDLESVLYQALSLRSNAVGIFPKNVDAKLLTEGMGSKSDFLSFINYIDKQVSFFITGQTMATTSDGKGSYAQAKEHANRLTEKQTFDAKLIGKTITDFLNMIIQQNFSTPKEVVFRFVIKEQRNLKEASEVVKNLEGAGFEIPAKHIEKEFGIEGVKRKASTGSATEANRRVLSPDNTDNNAQNKTLPLDKTAAEVAKADLNSVEVTLMERFLNVLETAESYEEAFEILDTDENIDTDELETLLAQYIANAHLQGLDDGNV